MLISIAGEESPNPKKGERYFAKRYINAPHDSSDAVQLRQELEKGARSYLENLLGIPLSSFPLSLILFPRFYQNIEDLIQRNPEEAKVGGVPTPEHKIKAYINIKLAAKDRWKE